MRIHIVFMDVVGCFCCCNTYNNLWWSYHRLFCIDMDLCGLWTSQNAPIYLNLNFSRASYGGGKQSISIARSLALSHPPPSLIIHSILIGNFDIGWDVTAYIRYVVYVIKHLMCCVVCFKIACKTSKRYRKYHMPPN